MNKFLALILPALLVLQVAAAQPISFTAKEQSLGTVFREIEKQTAFRFVYVMDILSSANPVSVRFEKAGISDVLSKIFNGQPLRYEVKDKTIIVSRQEERTKSSNTSSGKKNIDLSGRVTNEMGDPVIGATIAVRGSEKSTATTIDGSFMLKDVQERAVIIISNIGYETRTIRLSGEVNLNVVMKVAATEMKEVVVMNTGYQQLPKERATGSFEVIGEKKFNQRFGTSILNRLEGISGSILFDKRFLSPSSYKIEPGNMIIRGVSTVTETIKAPLIVLNNFPYEGDLNSINPNDVESITILRDAAAASIWGARAGNGVIVITTRRGNYKQAPSLAVTANYTIVNKPDLFRLPYMSSSDYIDVEKMLFENGFYDSDIDPANTMRPAITPVVEILSMKRDGRLTEERAKEMIDSLRHYDLRNDVSKYLYRKAITQQYALSLTGGSEQVKYSLTAGYDRELTSLTGNQNRRMTLRSDNTFQPVRNLEIQLALSLSSTKNELNSIGEFRGNTYAIRTTGGYKSIYPYARLADENGNPLATPKEYRQSYIQSLQVPGLLNWDYKVLDELRTADNSYRLLDILLNAGVSYKLSKYMQAGVNFQYENASAQNENYYSMDSWKARDMINLFSNWTGTQLIYRVPKGGILYTSLGELKSFNGRAQFNYNQTFGGLHQVTALAAGEIRERAEQFSGSSSYGYNKENLSNALVNYDTVYTLFNNLGYGTGRIIHAGGHNLATERFLSFLANASYIFDNRITITASARRDASNLFGVETNNKWQPLWSVGASWEPSAEKFYKSEILPFLKLRATYGIRGNVNNKLSRIVTIQREPAIFSLINLPFAHIVSPADPSLRWESVADLNLGIDFRFKNARLGGTIEYFRKRSKDLISYATLDPTTGISAVQKNSARLANNGFQVALNSVNIDGPLRWTTSLNLNYVFTKVLDYERDDKGRTVSALVSGGTSINMEKGKDPYGIFSLPFAGLDPENGDPMGYLGNKVSKNYYDILQQLADTTSIIEHGSAIPRYFGNFTNTFSWKNFNLSINLLYRFSYYVRKQGVSYEGLLFNGAILPEYSQRWQKKGDEAHTVIPSMQYPLVDNYRDQFFYLSSANIIKGDNVRIQYIRVSYDVSSPVFGAKFIRNLQLSFNANDLGVIWRAEKQVHDPEYITTEGGYYPPVSYNIGCTITF